MKPIVRSLLETDLYKFTMWQALLHRHPNAHGEYEFRCRNEPAYPLAELKEEVERELDHLCEMLFSEDEISYLRSLRFIKSDFADFLTVFRFQRKFITVETDGPHLRIRAVGPVVHVMGFEIYVLYIVNELYFRRFDKEHALREARVRLAEKIEQFRAFELEPKRANNFAFFDFGVRRRFSGEWQDEVVETLQRELPQFFKGTSNVYLARKYNLVPIGTMAHEYMQAFQSFGVRLRDFQKAALEDWVQEYRGDLGTALTDVVGMDAFLRDFDLYFAKLFDGLRHDSGDPLQWAEKAIAHYQQLGIDPLTKTLVFSDSLNLEKALALFRALRERINVSFGIGTHFTCDIPGVQPMNMVLKMSRCNGQPVAKISDAPGKAQGGEPDFLHYLRHVFQVNGA